MRRTLPLPFLTCACLILAGCTSDEGPYPSLAKRPAERVTASWPPAPPPPPPLPQPLDPAKRDKLGLMLAEIRSADARFHAKEDRVRSLVTAAKGAPMGSESWSNATVAVSELEAARAQAMVAMAELDSLYAEARITGLDVAPIEATRQQAVAIISGQDRVLESLKGALDR